MPVRNGRLKVGIVGCGVVATAYYMPYMLRRKGDFEIVAVCDNNERRVKLCAKLFGVPGTHVDYYDMVKRAAQGQNCVTSASVRSTSSCPPSGPTRLLAGSAPYEPAAIARAVGRYPL